MSSHTTFYPGNRTNFGGLEGPLDIAEEPVSDIKAKRFVYLIKEPHTFDGGH